MTLRWWWRAAGDARGLRLSDYVFGAATLVIVAPIAAMFVLYIADLLIGRGWPADMNSDPSAVFFAISAISSAIIFSPFLAFVSLPIGFTLFAIAWRSGATGYLPAMLIGAITGPATSLLVTTASASLLHVPEITAFFAIPGAIMGILFWIVIAARAVRLPPQN